MEEAVEPRCRPGVRRRLRASELRRKGHRSPPRCPKPSGHPPRPAWFLPAMGGLHAVRSSGRPTASGVRLGNRKPPTAARSPGPPSRWSAHVRKGDKRRARAVPYQHPARDDRHLDLIGAGRGRRGTMTRRDHYAPATPLPTMTEGSHTLSKVSASTWPDLRAASRRVVPLASASSAIWAAFW